MFCCLILSIINLTWNKFFLKKKFAFIDVLLFFHLIIWSILRSNERTKKENVSQNSWSGPPKALKSRQRGENFNFKWSKNRSSHLNVFPNSCRGIRTIVSLNLPKHFSKKMFESFVHRWFHTYFRVRGCYLSQNALSLWLSESSAHL